MRRRGFTIVEFMVLFGIVIILLSILIPYGLRVRELDSRARCADNLRQIYLALQTYAKQNANNYPRVIYDEASNPTSYTAFTGADDENAFMPGSAVQPNDVTASLWLLVRLGFVKPEAFVCPSSDDSPDLVTDAIGRNVKSTQRANFRRPSNLSYSYSSPFSNAPRYRMNVDRPSTFALMADKSPGIEPPDADITAPGVDAPPLEMARTNSRNHGRAGQNVLYPGYVEWKKSPYCGVQGDNIYTALASAPLVDRNLPAKGNGYWSHEIGPAWEGDSYLVPTATDGVNTGLATLRHAPPATVPATAPATTPASAPASQP